jgi:hypothetical protein
LEAKLGAQTADFILLGLFAVVPVTAHLAVTYGLGELPGEMGFAWLLAFGALCIMRAFICSVLFTFVIGMISDTTL